MVAVQPTRGLDIGAIENVHRLLLAHREERAAILLISEDLDEILDPVRPGRRHLRGPNCRGVRRHDADIHDIGLMMTGGEARGGRRSRMQAAAADHRRTPAQAPRWLPLAVTIGAVFVSS